VTEAEILVEVEPVRYELKDTVFIRDRAKVSQEIVPLGFRILVNPDEEEEEEDEQVTDHSNGVKRGRRIVYVFSYQKSNFGYIFYLLYM
jgi:hypothetical protein